MCSVETDRRVAGAEQGRILVERDDSTLVITVPGRVTEGCWLASGLATLFVLVVGGILILGETDVRRDYVKPQETLFLLLFVFCLFLSGVCIYVTLPRREVIVLDRKWLTVKGAFGWHRPLRMSTRDIGAFVLRPVRAYERKMGTLVFDSGLGSRRMILFATREAVPPSRVIQPPRWNPLIALDSLREYWEWMASSDRRMDLPLAIQATDGELVWLRGVLSEYLSQLG